MAYSLQIFEYVMSRQMHFYSLSEMTEYKDDFDGSTYLSSYQQPLQSWADARVGTRD